MLSSAGMMLAIALTGFDPGGTAPAIAGEPRPQGTLDAQLEEYADLLVTLGEQAVRQPRLGSPLPCVAHWIAGRDRVIVAVSKAGSGAGLEPSDTLRRIAGRNLTGPGDDRWETAMRALPQGRPSYVVEIEREGKRLRLVLPVPCDDVVEVAEKQPISNWATVGLYGFSSAACFAKHYEDAYERERIRLMRGERYVAPMYELMLTHGERVVAPRLNREDVHILGTPAQVLDFDPAAQPPFGSRSPRPP